MVVSNPWCDQRSLSQGQRQAGAGTPASSHHRTLGMGEGSAALREEVCSTGFASGSALDWFAMEMNLDGQAGSESASLSFAGPNRS